jgi:hypothetical protein
LSDLGEGKQIVLSARHEGCSSGTDSSHLGLNEYCAPEISKQGYTKETDVYAWARLAVSIIRTYNARLAHADEFVRFPIKLIALVQACLDENPKYRLTAESLVFMLDDAQNSLIDKDPAKVRWTDESYDLPQAMAHIDVSSTLGEMMSNLSLLS